MRFKNLQKEIHQNSIDTGLYDRFYNNIAEKLCLVHSEISEALEALRKHDINCIGEELADIVIKVMDLSEYLNINLEKKILKKHNFNKIRL